MNTRLTKTLMGSPSPQQWRSAYPAPRSRRAMRRITMRMFAASTRKGLVSVDPDRVPKLRWEPGTKRPYRRHPVQRKRYADHPLRHGKHRGLYCFDVSGSVGTYTVAADCTGTISITDGPTFNMYVGRGAQQLSIINWGRSRRRHRNRFGNGDTAAVARTAERPSASARVPAQHPCAPKVTRTTNRLRAHRRVDFQMGPSSRNYLGTSASFR